MNEEEENEENKKNPVYGIGCHDACKPHADVGVR